MDYVILDLEWNNTYSNKRKKHINEIIEIGALKINNDFEVLDAFSLVVKPQIGKNLNSRVKNLTNLSFEDLTDGVTFMNAIKQFRSWLGNSVVMTWSTTDIIVLMDNFLYYSGSNKLKFIKKYVDAQSYCQNRIDFKKGTQIGLSVAGELLNIEFEHDSLHRALNDCYLTFEILKKIYVETELKEHILDATTSEFYRWITFKSTIISDLKNPLINHNNLIFYCEDCAEEAIRLERWEFKNRWHKTVFFCSCCNKKFVGKIQFKIKYDGLYISKKIIPFYAESEIEKEEQTAEFLPKFSVD